VAVSAAVATARASVLAAEGRVRVAELESRPDFMVGAGVGFRGDMDAVVAFRLGMELPIWQGARVRPLRRAAQAEHAASLADLRDAEARARSEANALRADWERVQNQVVRYQQSFVPQSSLAFDAARTAYLGGRGDFSTVIEDLNIWLEARTGLARWESERFRAWARLETLLSPTSLTSDGASQGETR
jgi:outer membrane protein TolC